MSIDAKAMQLEFEFVKGLEQKKLENDANYNLNLLVVVGTVVAASMGGLYKLCDYLDIPEKLNSCLTQLNDYVMNSFF